MKSTRSDPCYAASSGSNTFGNWQYQNTVNTTYFNPILRPHTLDCACRRIESRGQHGARPDLSCGDGQRSRYPTRANHRAHSIRSTGGQPYFNYNERGFQGPIPARDFHANVDTVSVKCVF